MAVDIMVLIKARLITVQNVLIWVGLKLYKRLTMTTSLNNLRPFASKDVKIKELKDELGGSTNPEAGEPL